MPSTSVLLGRLQKRNISCTCRRIFPGKEVSSLATCIYPGITKDLTSDPQLSISPSSSSKLSTILHKLPIDSSSSSLVSTISYRTHPAWEAEAKRLTAGGRGVDIALNNAGPTSLAQDVEALAPRRGVVSVVGFLGGLNGGGVDAGTMLRMMVKGASVRYVFSPSWLVGVVGLTGVLAGAWRGRRRAR